MSFTSMDFGTSLSIIITIINIGLLIVIYSNIGKSKKRINEIKESKKELDDLINSLSKRKEPTEVVSADIIEDNSINENNDALIELINFQLIREGDTPDLNLYAIRQPNNILRRKISPLSEITNLLKELVNTTRNDFGVLYIEAEKEKDVVNHNEHAVVNRERVVGEIHNLNYYISDDYNTIRVVGSIRKIGYTPTPIQPDTIYPVFAQRNKNFAVQYGGLDFLLVEYLKLIKFYYKAI